MKKDIKYLLLQNYKTNMTTLLKWTIIIVATTFLSNSIITNIYGQGNSKNSTETFYPLGPLQFSAKIDVGMMIAIAALVVALFYNAKQMINNTKTNESMFWLSLREFIIQHHEYIHKKLRPGGKLSNVASKLSNNEWPDVEAYMGLFEHINIMLQEGQISDKIFKNIYGYRLKNILHNNMIKKEKLEEFGDSWQDFIALCRKAKLGKLLPNFLFVPIKFLEDEYGNTASIVVGNFQEISFKVIYMGSGKKASKAKVKLNFYYPSGISQKPIEKETNYKGQFYYSWIIEENALTSASKSGDAVIGIQVSKGKYKSNELLRKFTIKAKS
jgi:hypothetical protein